MQKYGLDIYIQIVRTGYMTRSFNHSSHVFFMPVRASCPPLIICSWFSGLLGLVMRGSAVDAEILSICVLPSHPHECITYFIWIHKRKTKLKPAETSSQPEKKEIKVTIMQLSSVYRLKRFNLWVTMGAIRIRVQTANKNITKINSLDSFWRHPFTASNAMLNFSKCGFDEETGLLDGLRLSTFSANDHFLDELFL